MNNRKYKISICILIIAILLIRNLCSRTSGYTQNSYPTVNITDSITSEFKSEADYLNLYRQTGLSPEAIDEICMENKYDTAYKLQKLFHQKPDITRNYILFPFTAEERTYERLAPIAPLKNGDIIVTFNTVSCDWRHGHSAIVVNSEKMQILEHRSAGSKSCISPAELFGMYPSFIVLRHPDAAIASEAAGYASSQLNGINYSLLAGLIRKDKTNLPYPITSHCSHIVWQAYKAAGADIDRDKGFIVTPRDIVNSEKLKVVQVFGMDTADFEHRLAK